jgi:hypothetical protein
MARPKIKLDLDRIRDLASINCTVHEIAIIEGVNKKTLERRAMDVIEEGRANCRASLRRKQHEVAMAGNAAMLIWLGKNQLDQSDKVENTHDFGYSLKSILAK